ncbi:FMN-binding glutamate synthase family protein [Haloferula sargassicola]|uniref:Glutamate synthase domain-containing protein n=1 Tax=Haloferula sargassicola TaxID=490096 RepID=A0ABP9UGP7_9BACT
MPRLFLILSVLAIALVATIGWFFPAAWWAMVVIGPLVGIGLYDLLQTRNNILRNFPLLGHLRYFFEFISPEIQQYFIERHTDGTPVSENHRNLVYSRAKDRTPTHPFGTELDLYLDSYEGLRHSIYAEDPPDEPPRVRIGGTQCTQPYEASLLNISAMSFGAISKNAVLAMNHGAQLGGFYQNTGEGGLSKYHLEHGGDIVWQIGTAYFGCRTKDGGFDPDSFQDKATKPQVKMIELKISQGAKPGHGGVLPAVKNDQEIADIREIEPHQTVKSPPGHKEFSDAAGLLRFIQRLRELSGGKPTGFKLCLGRKEEFEEICRQMHETGIRPDFITIDGAEGGTGAAPLEFTDSVGYPLEPALKFIDRALRQQGLRDEIRVIASGKVVTAFHLVKMLCLGADLCNSARAFMFSVGCIQAQRCDTNSCPTGVTTQNPKLVRGLVPEQKAPRVANYHKHTVHAAMELMFACGIKQVGDLDPDLIVRGLEWKPEGGVRAG